MTMFSRFMNDESGATAIEYGLIAAVVGIGIIIGLGTLKTALNKTFSDVSSALTTASSN
jgi:pilus assembly protein Flp/PilA